ncbi:MAG: hypothetical protein NDI60_01845 [Elusimicrobiales bacterium]|nr:hypothetical protein [Elusimicrobiales bacterium]
MRKFLALALLAGACGCGKTPDLPAMARLETYAFSPASSLESRMTAVPAEVLEYFSAEDKRPDYASYLPTPEEKQLLLDYLRLLPPVYEKVFKARCVGIYFISGFTGNGVTNWVIGPGDKVYFYLALNPAAFKQDLSQTLTERERSCFKPKPGWEVAVAAGGKYKGLLYALAHEAAHGLDYAAGVSPYTDDTMPERYRPAKCLTGNFFPGVWQGYRQPLPAADFPLRDQITFYGLGGGPRLELYQAPGLYMALAKSQFASLYGARSWAEDLAELETFHTLTAVLGQQPRITLKGPDGVRYTIRPMDGPAAARAAVLRQLLQKVPLSAF